MNINKIIIPAAGIGSRFLPITKSIPKEMLPLSNKPCIEYIVQEAFDAGITNIAMILSPEKNLIKEYFEQNTHLDKILAEKDQLFRVESINKLIQNLTFNYFYQYQPAGVADALLQAKNFIQPDEHFAVAYPDDIIFGKNPEIANLINIANKMQGMVIAVQKVPVEKISAYGVISITQQINERCWQVASIIEKPKTQDAPSNLAIVGRYIYHHDILNFIPQTPKYHNCEVLLTDTINLMIQHGYPVFAYEIEGTRFDTGTPQGWLEYIIKHHTFEINSKK
ncbi:MAG: UTP--glucose-1-phosphate uridylyltransferase [Candidatus Chromulinivorax sp.]